MTTIEVTIGWTKSAMPEYSSFADGYKPGAQQHVEVIEVEVPETVPVSGMAEFVAEAVFTATNSPYEVSGLPGQIRDAIAAKGYRGQGAHYSLSTGDTVTVGEVMLACESFGWKQVYSQEVSA